MKKIIVIILIIIVLLSAAMFFYTKEKSHQNPVLSSGTDIESIVENYKTFEVNNGGTFHNLTDATSYEIINPADYEVQPFVKNGVKCIKVNDDWVDNLSWGNTFLMKDKKIVEITFDGIYESDFSEIDSIVFADSKVVRILKNPYYKGK